jgi:hypothetical protein
MAVALHALGDEHETASSVPSCRCGAGGVGVMLQRDPFQRSASVTESSPPARSYDTPTATQSVPETHEIASNDAPRDPAGVGVLWLDQ